MDKLADCSTAQTRWLHAERRGGLGSGGLRGWGPGRLGGWGGLRLAGGCWALDSGLGLELGWDLVGLKRKLVY